MLASCSAGLLAVATALPAASTPFLHSAFGSGGEAFPISSTSTLSQANAVAVAPAGTGLTGDLLAVGYEAPSNSRTSEWAVVAASSATGALVSGFGSGGVVTGFGGGSGSPRATGVAVYPPCPASDSTCNWSGEVGVVVVVGSGANADTDEVVAYSPKGALVWSYVLQPTRENSAGSPSVALAVNGTDPSGDAMVVDSGVPSTGGPQQPIIAALTPAGSSGTGTLDRSFGGGIEFGSFLPAGSTSPALQSFAGVAVDSSGDVVVAGTSVDGKTDDSGILVARYLPDGVLDTTFGTADSGTVLLGNNDTAAGMTLEPESGGYRVLVAGTAASSGGSPSQVLGAADQTGAPVISTSGIVRVPTPAGGASATDVTVQVPKGASTATGIVVSGSTQSTRSALSRAIVTWLGPNATAVAAFGSGGSLTLPSRTSVSVGAFGVAPAPGGVDMLVGGSLAGSTDTTERFGLARVTGQLVQISASVAKSGSTDIVTVTANPFPTSTSTIDVKWSATGSSGIIPSPASGIDVIGAGSHGTFKITVKFGAASGTLTLSTSASSSRITPQTVPAVASLKLTAPPGGVLPQGYYLAGRNGNIGSAGSVPVLAGFSTPPSNPVVGIAVTPDGKGYFAVTADGDVHVAGDAHSHGDLAHLPGGGSVRASDIVAIAPTVDGRGYWLIGADGGEFAFGDAKFRGSLPGIHIHVDDIVGMVASPSAEGYLIVGADGGVFAFGRTKYFGSLPGLHVKVDDIRAILPAPAGTGYVLVGADGGAFVFGHGAPYKGSLPGEHVHVNDIVGLALTPDGQGYWMAGSDGTVYPFGDAHPFGAPAGLASAVPIASIGGT